MQQGRARWPWQTEPEDLALYQYDAAAIDSTTARRPSKSSRQSSAAVRSQLQSAQSLLFDIDRVPSAYLKRSSLPSSEASSSRQSLSSPQNGSQSARSQVQKCVDVARDRQDTQSGIDPDPGVQGLAWKILLVSAKSLPTLNSEHHKIISHAVTKLAMESAQAQNLLNPITSVSKLSQMPEQRLYMLHSPAFGFGGMLKVETRNIYMIDDRQNQVQQPTLCVLDFVITSELRRAGCGRILFDKMLKYEKAQASDLAYDRPSARMINFMGKHYGLSNAVMQPNRYMFFTQGHMRLSGHTPRHRNSNTLDTIAYDRRRSAKLISDNVARLPPINLVSISSQSYAMPSYGRFDNRNSNSMKGILY